MFRKYWSVCTPGGTTAVDIHEEPDYSWVMYGSSGINGALIALCVLFYETTVLE